MPDQPKTRRERASVVCVHERYLLTVRLEDPASGVTDHFLPGGALEAGETPVVAAERETLEETGYAVRVDESSHRSRRYDFRWDDRVYDCTTHFFAATLADPGVTPAMVNDAPYHRGVTWLELCRVAEVFAYHPVILAEIRGLLPPTARP